MRSSVHTLLRPIAAGLFSLALGAACWAWLGSVESKTLSLRELAQKGGALMSCVEDAGDANEPLWCADPDSPHCIPALPKAPSAEAWHGPVAALPALTMSTPALVGQLLAWPARTTVSLTSLKLPQRLERPPRHV